MDAQVVVAQDNDGEKVEHEISTPHHVDEREATRDTGIPAAAAPPHVVSPATAIHSAHDAVAGENVPDPEISTPALPAVVVDNVKAAPKDHTHTFLDGEEAVAPGIAAPIIPAAVGEPHIAPSSADVKEDIVPEGHGGGHESLSAEPAHEAASQHTTGPAPEDTGEPPAPGQTPDESHMDIENTDGGHHAIHAGPPESHMEIENTDGGHQAIHAGLPESHMDKETTDGGHKAIHESLPESHMDVENTDSEHQAIHAGLPDAGEAPAVQETPFVDVMDETQPNAVDHAAAVPFAAAEALPVAPLITTMHLDIDSNESDADSAVGDVDFQSSTVSVRSSIYDMVEENGRTYHRYKEGKYVLPNDEFEQNRLDLQHHLFVMTLHGALHLAPLQEGIQDVLDLATGTGIWAIEFATKYPSARVIGTDLSPIQPLYVPPNCSFEVDDADDPWLFAQKFDYIHGRLLVACFPDFSVIARQAFEFMKPGGYFELQDLLPFDCADESWEGCDLQRLMNLLREGAAKAGMDYVKAAKYKHFLADAGFEDVHEVHFAWPSNGRWPKGEHYKNLGRWNHQNMLDGIEGISMGTLTRMHGWTKQEVETLMMGVKRDLADRSIHAYLPVRVVFGRKPLE